jgi:gp49
MKQYIGTKKVQATPMNRGDYNALRGWQVPENENPADDGYLVVYPNGEPNVDGFDGYVSWSPKKQFEEAYQIAETFKDRLAIEYAQLEERLGKLRGFIQSEQFQNLAEEDRNLLVGQEKAMDSYLTIVNTRIIMLTDVVSQD